MANKVTFPSREAAASVMGALYAAKIVGTWNDKRTSKGVTVRYLDVQARVYRDLIQFDLERFGLVSTGSAH